MSDSFAALKANRKSRLEKLQTKLNEDDKPAYKSQDERLWFPSKNKDGNGFAKIRFLPSPKGEDYPWVRMFSHGFQGPTGDWYIENSLTTIGKKDPVGELNRKLWATGIEANQNTARKQKRKVSYYANILVLSDPENQENEGKVMLFRFGKKIWDMINSCMNPPDPVMQASDGKAAFNPFDFWDGSDFTLILKQVGGYNNYDDSRFDAWDQKKAIDKNDEEIEAIWIQQYSLKDFITEDKFEPFSDLKTKLDTILGGDSSVNDEDMAPAPSIEQDLATDTPTTDEEDNIPFDVNEEGDEDYAKLLAD